MAIQVERESLSNKARFVTPTYTNQNNGQEVVGSDRPYPTIDINHLRLHEGRAHYVYKMHPDNARLAVNGNINIALAFPAGIEAHAVLEYQCGGEAEFYAYENATTNGGTAMTLHNRNRSINRNSQGAAVLNPTISSVGTEFYAEFISSASGPGHSSGSGGGNFSFEFVLKPLTTYLFRLTNVNSASQMAELRIDWYE
jgi:hypothetical protein